MMSLPDKQRKQDLGIFYTPPEVVNFIFDILNIWKEKEDREKKRWQSRQPKPHCPSVIDPAAGEGVFLKGALESEFTKPHYVFGVDIDETVTKRWEEINLIASFDSRAELENHFFHQNGLLPLKENKVLRYKTGGLKEFDVAVGNPPYGGIGVDFEGKLSPENMELLEALEKYEIFAHKKVLNGKKAEANEQNSLFAASEASVKRGSVGRNEVVKLAQGLPIEIIFVERFIQLVKPEGWVAIIIPDGILSNSNAHYVRDFISSKSKVEAVVSLPRDTFKQAGTSAKTSILFLRKLGENENPPLEHRVFLATADKISSDSFNHIIEKYKQFYNSNNIMNNSKLVQVIKDDSGKEVAMVRADLTVEDLMEEKPTSRWSPEYWHPHYDDIIAEIRKQKTVLLDNHRDEIKSGYRSGNVRFTDSGVPYLQVRNILETGVDLQNADLIPKNSPARQENKKVVSGDVLLNRSGEGSVGRLTVFLSNQEAYVGGHVYRFSVKNISPVYITVFLKTFYGREQIRRFESGVSGQTAIDLEDILHLEIPILTNNMVEHIESEYKKMSVYHYKAMEAKKKNDEAGYKKNIETAEKMLKDLIAKTEAVIRGERKDVI